MEHDWSEAEVGNSTDKICEQCFFSPVVCSLSLVPLTALGLL